jgi:hypothetical protein
LRDAGAIWTRARRRAKRFARDDLCDASDRFLGPPKMVMFLDGLVFDDARKKKHHRFFSRLESARRWTRETCSRVDWSSIFDSVLPGDWKDLDSFFSSFVKSHITHPF